MLAARVIIEYQVGDWSTAEEYLRRLRDVLRHVDFVERDEGLPEGFTRQEMIRRAGVPAEAIGEFLDELERKYGGPLQYLRGIGVSDDRQNAIREVLLERE